MTKNSIDPRELLIGGSAFVVGSLTSLGIVGPEVLGLDFSNVLISEAQLRVTLGSLLQIVSLGYIFFNRDIGFLEFQGEELWLVSATGILVLAPPVFPGFQESLASMPIALGAFLVQTGGLTLISIKN